MDKRTKLAALQMLAKAAAELAADIATATSEAAGFEHDKAHAADLPLVRANLIVGTLMPAEQALEELAAVLKAVGALHQSRAI